jgi:hypothetical protein
MNLLAARARLASAGGGTIPECLKAMELYSQISQRLLDKRTDFWSLIEIFSDQVQELYPYLDKITTINVTGPSWYLTLQDMRALMTDCVDFLQDYPYDIPKYRPTYDQRILPQVEKLKQYIVKINVMLKGNA